MADTNGYLYDWEQLLRGKPAEPRTDVVPATADTLANADGYTRAAVNGELAGLAEAEEGVRNHVYNKAAWNLGQLVGAGVLVQGTVEQMLRETGRAIGLEEREIRDTLRSGMTAGIAHPRQIKPLGSVTQVSVQDILPAATSADPGAELGAAEATTWLGDDLVGGAVEALSMPEPTHLLRTDGKALLYSGKVNALIGESESGKSWLALLVAVQALQAGEQVLILDFEDNVASVLGRFLAFGFSHDELRGRVHYIRPEEALGAAQVRDLQTALAGGFGVIIVDGINSAMDLLGYDLNSNNDATTFYRRLLRPLAVTGACVVTVDHVPKNQEGRGKGGLGAQAKRAMADGGCLLVEVVEPFGEGQSGVLRLTIDKDRNGKLRGISAAGKNPGRVKFTSIAGRVHLEIEPPDGMDEGPGERREQHLSALMEKVSRLVEEVGPLSGRQIREATTGNTQQVLQAINELVRRGYLRHRSGARRAIIYTSTRPYRGIVEDSTGSGSAAVPGGSENGQGVWFPRFPSPLGGDHSAAETKPLEDQNGGTSGRADPDSQPACQRCGSPVAEEIFDETAGYCRSCGRLENP